MSAPEDQVADFWGRALDSLAAADTLMASGFPDSAASRAYYAAFYAASALLAAEGKTFSSHRGVLSNVHKLFVKEGRLPREAGWVIDSLFALRQVGDYGGALHVTHPRAEQALADARRFLDAIRPLLPDDI